MVSKEDVVSIFSKIPLDVWDKIVDNEPEKKYMGDFHKRYGFGRFAVLMVVAGLNDYQLKGKADIAYWPVLRDILNKNKTPDTLDEMKDILSEFYIRERFATRKLDRLNRFLSSKLASELWNSIPKKVAENFINIWYRLAFTMNQNIKAKTIVFAMKCLGISLIIAGESNFTFERIPIPVDYRVRRFIERIGVNVRTDDDVRMFWSRVLLDIRKRVPINMIHLDSLIWQIGTMNKGNIIEYFSNLGLESIGEKLINILS